MCLKQVGLFSGEFLSQLQGMSSEATYWDSTADWSRCGGDLLGHACVHNHCNGAYMPVWVPGQKLWNVFPKGCFVFSACEQRVAAKDMQDGIKTTCILRRNNTSLPPLPLTFLFWIFGFTVCRFWKLMCNVGFHLRQHFAFKSSANRIRVTSMDFYVSLHDTTGQFLH